MPEHIRALIVVLLVGSLAWIMARPAAVQVVMPETFSRWRKLWYLTTLAWFLSPSFWVYVGIMTAVLLMVGRREPHVFGLYLLLLIAAPPSEAPIPGFGVVNHIIVMNHYRLLALAFLLPIAWRLWVRPSTARLLHSPLDWLVLGYLLLNSLLAYRGGNLTNDTRTALMLWIDFFLPYYVASRSIRNMEDFRYALTGLVIGGVLLSALAVVEVIRGWKLYEGASSALGLGTWGEYKMRGPFMRPAVTIIDSIVLGYVLVVAAGAFLYLRKFVDGWFWRSMGILVLMVGVLASLSRGPWVGAVLLLLVFVLIGEKPLKQIARLSFVFAIFLSVILIAPKGQGFIDMLPFVGNQEQDNVEYRASLLAAARPVIERNLLFGSTDYLDAPELQVMRQGEGIIDVVNSYLGVALNSGLVGLSLFLAMFLSAVALVRKGRRIAKRQQDAEAQLAGQALIAIIVSIMFIIFTVSSMFVAPVVYFSMVGLSCAFGLIQSNR